MGCPASRLSSACPRTRPAHAANFAHPGFVIGVRDALDRGEDLADIAHPAVRRTQQVQPLELEPVIVVR